MPKNKIDFNPLKSENEHLRAEFWDRYADDFVSITDALSSNSFLQGELRLCNKYLRKGKKEGKFLKLDVWNEVHHTPLLDHIWNYYDAVYAIDIAPRLIKRAKEILKKKNISVKFSVGDMRKLSYKDNFFDYAFTIGTIEHIPEPVDAIKEIYRVLKPGGRAAIGVPNKYEWFGKSIILDILADTGFKEDGREISYGWSRLTEEVESCGFEIIEKTGLYFMPWFIRLIDWYLYQTSPKLKYVMYIPVLISDFLSRFDFLRKHGSMLVVVLEKPRK